MLEWDPIRRSGLAGFASSGPALWLGSTSKHAQNLFLDDANVTENAYEAVPGRRWVSRMGVSANARGDLLWLPRNSYEEWEVWYFELVPQPAGLSAICIGAAAVGLSRRCRGRWPSLQFEAAS